MDIPQSQIPKRTRTTSETEDQGEQGTEKDNVGPECADGENRGE